ncbi:Mrp family chromosome partitioning ATPase [Saccharopolyspora erythraea NRRL 2338]|uniref:Cell surface polysaccharide biosynthesis / chain length determinant protein n=1 Tax=Saccharopolyspora erythraea (strain ATCC 11635 / DSM 40517 / JCM 4748 / NBRC 13426 / NCIMB 8594 / NRRL 2338) TaxID=405948 RepID=A4FEI6_SACEN|nr:CpsD/CapB family tyrosine-protein kinase [Saccharopolyspora erythraea]PFG96187.1 Mrp family chromosome partitioning ATPase [Saccharopolyspora erythraea NRRL 2338]QRK92719.1 CpsD/CapB family tyrosine-protein kinase [Saccharopolyspora erythraea]CAM02461.1 cell surface polysaccharide biosynthesis / chain length determinant protein [Saccharopolyspora erythraea NRRL 2338]
MDDTGPGPTIFGALWRYRRSSLAIVAVAVLVSFVVALAAGDGRTARARIVLRAPDQTGALGIELTSEASFVRYVKQRALFVTSDRVLSAARTRLGGPETLEQMRSAIAAEASSSGESIEITVDGAGLERSVLVANAVIAAYQDESRAEVTAATENALATLNTQRAAVVAEIPEGGAIAAAAGQTLSEIDKQMSSIRVVASQFDDGVAFVDHATAGAVGPWRGVLRDVAIGLAAGLVVAAATAWFRADRDRRVRHAGDLAGVVSEPLLGEIETLPAQAVPSLSTPGVPPLRSYQLVASGLRTMVGTGVVMVTGASAGEGATTTTLQIAGAAARDGLRVLVVDAAVRSRDLSRLLGLADWLGLTSIATGAASLEQATHSVHIGDGVGFSVVPAGHAHRYSRDQLRSSSLRRVIADMRARYDLVLVDLPPLSSQPETTSLIGVSDGVLVTVRREGDLRSLRKLRGQIHLFGGTITGYVLTFTGADPTRRAAEPAVPQPVR